VNCTCNNELAFPIEKQRAVVITDIKRGSSLHTTNCRKEEEEALQDH
jgi:hypothetical protein